MTAPSPTPWDNLFDLLVQRATETPGRSWYVRAQRGAQEFRTLSQLLQTSQRLAHALRARGVQPGEPVLLAQPAGFEFLTSFFALQAVGAVPIPLHWPGHADPFRGIANLARWRRIARRYEARVLICADLGSEATARWRALWPPHPLEIVTDTASLLVDVPTRVTFEPHRAAPDDVAYIQSTSGTTGAPRGAQITHRGLLCSVEATGLEIHAGPDDVLVSWLPLDNIMGLVGVVLFSLHWGVRPVLMRPEQFLEHPEDWFWAISEHRGTLSLAPNFAYNYCVRRCNESALEGLNLKSWRVAMNGSEPIRAQHMQAFARRFHPYGLRDHVLMPVYGLSEATLGVTFHPAGTPLRIDGINRRDLETTGHATPLPPEGAARPPERMHVVSVGRPLKGVEVKVVDDSGDPLPERRLGEVVVKSPSIMAGYVEGTLRDDKPDPSFIDDGGWLHTGDLAYLADGDLFLISRASDTARLPEGRILFPEEVELFVDAIDGVRSGSTVAIQDPDTDDGVAIAFEVQTGADPDELSDSIEALLQKHFEITPTRLLPLPPRSIPKTTTGKVRRHRCRRLLSEDLLRQRPVGPLHPARLQRGARDVGENLRSSGQALVHRLRDLFPDGSLKD